MTEIMSWAEGRNPRLPSTLVIQAKRAFRRWRPIAYACLADRALGH